MGEQKTIEQTFQIESPEIEVGLLGTQDKFVSLIEQGMDVEIRPLNLRSMYFVPLFRC